MFVSITNDAKVHTFRASKLFGPFKYLGPLTSINNYAGRIIKAGNKPLLLHTVPRRWQHNDIGDLMRGMLAQPKELLFDESGYPYLGWYSPLEKYFLSNELQSGNNGLFTVQLPINYSEIKIGLRINKKNLRKSGLELVVNKEQLNLYYLEDKQLLESEKLINKIRFKEIKILLFGEYIEIYCDNKLLVSTISYRHNYGYFEAYDNKKAIDFSFRPYNKKMGHIIRDDLNVIA